jgi:hypothetical protein
MLPGGIKGRSAYNGCMGEPRRPFVLLRHRLSDSTHWDLMLDTGQVLATWQFAADPAAVASDRGQIPLSARRLPDHRRFYLDYEGPVSGNRGEVARIDQGVYLLLDERPDQWTVELHGSVLAGRFRLFADPPGSDCWRLQPVDD